MAKENPGVDGIWLAETYMWFRQVAKDVCDELFGHEAIWHGTNYTYTFPRFGNSRILVYSYEKLQRMQGKTAGWYTIDEHQNVGRDAYNEVIQRCSDDRVLQPMGLIEGLPEVGVWADDLAESLGDKCAHFTEIDLEVNAAHVHPEFLVNLQTLDPEEYARRKEGKKPTPQGTVFKTFVPKQWDPGAPNEQGNLVRWTYTKKMPLYIDIDFGSLKLGCTVSQGWGEREVVIDEHNLDNANTQDLCAYLQERYVSRAQATLSPRDPRKVIDMFCCDPAGNSVQTAEGITDIRILREFFPDVEIRYTFKSRLRSKTASARLCKARMLNQRGERLTLMDVDCYERGIKDTRTGKDYTKKKRGRSLALSWLRLQYPENAQGIALKEEPVICPIDSHAYDAWRYGQTNRHGDAQGSVTQFTAR